MEFRLLGPLEVVDGERPIPLGGAKQRSRPGAAPARAWPAGGDRLLIEEIWNGDAPETARKSVQGYVSSLRDALGEERIQTLERGYALRLEPGELDADRFEELIRAVPRSNPGQDARPAARGFWPVHGSRSRIFAASRGQNARQLISTSSCSPGARRGSTPSSRSVSIAASYPSSSGSSRSTRTGSTSSSSSCSRSTARADRRRA